MFKYLGVIMNREIDKQARNQLGTPGGRVLIGAQTV